MSKNVSLSGVPETMLQTVYARAKESCTRGAIHDPRAEEIVARLDYDFSLTEGMAEFVPVYRLLDKIPFVRSISNKIDVLVKTQD